MHVLDPILKQVKSFFCNQVLSGTLFSTARFKIEQFIGGSQSQLDTKLSFLGSADIEKVARQYHHFPFTKILKMKYPSMGVYLRFMTQPLQPPCSRGLKIYTPKIAYFSHTNIPRRSLSTCNFTKVSKLCPDSSTSYKFIFTCHQPPKGFPIMFVPKLLS